MSERADGSEFKAWHAVADLYHAYFTGLIMSLVTRRGSAEAAGPVSCVPAPAS
jgi:hypothetical protein